jgi:hypothetical protein
MIELPAKLSNYVPGRPATGSVFHYTSSVGLLNMVKSSKVWASEAFSLNDLAEVRQGWEAINRVLATMPESETRELLLSHAQTPLNGSHEVFVLCASTEGDDANQWRLYADAARGYVMELDSSVRLTAVSEFPARERPAPKPGKVKFDWSFVAEVALVTPWLHVIYKDDEVLEALEQLSFIVDGEHSYLETVAASGDEEAYNVERDRIRDESYGALASLANLIKSPGFIGENEVRIVATFVYNGDQIGYRAAANGIVGFATLTGAPEGHNSRVLRPVDKETPVPTFLPLKSVGTGPLLPEEHRNTLRGFLDRYTEAKKVKITHSKVQLR